MPARRPPGQSVRGARGIRRSDTLGAPPSLFLRRMRQRGLSKRLGALLISGPQSPCGPRPTPTRVPHLQFPDSKAYTVRLASCRTRARLHPQCELARPLDPQAGYAEILCTCAQTQSPPAEYIGQGEP